MDERINIATRYAEMELGIDAASQEMMQDALLGISSENSTNKLALFGFLHSPKKTDSQASLDASKHQEKITSHPQLQGM